MIGKSCSVERSEEHGLQFSSISRYFFVKYFIVGVVPCSDARFPGVSLVYSPLVLLVVPLHPDS